MLEKKRKKWDLNQKISAAIRKIWKQSPQRAHVLKAAVVDASVPIRSRKYRCALCKGHFSVTEMDIDHLESGHGKGETTDQRIERIFLGITKVEGELSAEDKFYCECHLRAVCFVCHKGVTKEQTKKAKEERKKDANTPIRKAKVRK